MQEKTIYMKVFSLDDSVIASRGNSSFMERVLKYNKRIEQRSMGRTFGNGVLQLVARNLRKNERIMRALHDDG